MQHKNVGGFDDLTFINLFFFRYIWVALQSEKKLNTRIPTHSLPLSLSLTWYLMWHVLINVRVCVQVNVCVRDRVRVEAVCVSVCFHNR